jgi:hypothetical protein
MEDAQLLFREGCLCNRSHLREATPTTICTVGVDGFEVLASRALRLSKSKSPKLSTVQITPDGTLRGLDEIERQADEDQNGEVGVILIAQLIELFVIFLGEAITLRLIEGVHLEFEVRPEPDATDSAGAEVPGNLLSEADR